MGVLGLTPHDTRVNVRVRSRRDLGNLGFVVKGQAKKGGQESGEGERGVTSP
jgi:hypothetical protein